MDLCPRGDLNPETRAFSPVLRLSTQAGEKSPVLGFHAAMLAGALWLPSSVSSAAGSSSRAARGPEFVKVQGSLLRRPVICTLCEHLLNLMLARRAGVDEV
jgi:hypothetical protein